MRIDPDDVLFCIGVLLMSVLLTPVLVTAWRAALLITFGLGVAL